MSAPVSAFGPQHLVGADNSQPHPATRIYDSEDDTGETRRGRSRMGDAPPAREGGHNVIKPKRCFACKAVGHLIAHCPRNPQAQKPPTAPLPPQANRTNTPTSTPTPRGGGRKGTSLSGLEGPHGISPTHHQAPGHSQHTNITHRVG